MDTKTPPRTACAKSRDFSLKGFFISGEFANSGNARKGTRNQSNTLVGEAPGKRSPLPVAPHVRGIVSLLIFQRSSAVPAITHVDGSSRLQTVDESCGAFFDLLQTFHRVTGVPMVLNASFNGLGEPIVEAPNDAVAFLLNTTLDVLYIDGYRVVRQDRD